MAKNNNLSFSGVLIILWALYPESSLAISGSGNYTFELEENLSMATYNLNLNGRQKDLYFNSSTNFQINVQDKKPDFTNTQLTIYNKLYNLALFNLSYGISRLVEPNLNLFGVKFEMKKKAQTSTFFAGKSAGSQVMGIKTNTEYGSNTSYGLFLWAKENTQILGLDFSKPIHKFSNLQGECYLNNENQWGLLLKNLINYKKTTLRTEYSIINNVPNFNLFANYKTKRLNTEIEYSRTNQANLWKLKGDFKTDKFNAGGYISNKKDLSESLLYNGYVGYNLKVLKKITPSILYSHSYSHLSQLSTENIYDSLFLKTTYLESKYPLSISTNIGIEMEKQESPTSIKSEVTFEKGLQLRYEYYGFRPWANFNVTTGEDKINTSYQKQSNSISYGISKNISRKLNISYNCYQSEDKSQSSSGEKINNRINKFLTLDYKFPKLPLNLTTKIYWINDNKPTSFLSLTYQQNKKKDTMVKSQDEEIKYARYRPVKIGTQTPNIASLSKEFANQETLLHSGKVIIMVFKDTDFDSKFVKEKDEPIKGVRLNLDKTEVVTNEEGKALFLDIPAGTYTFAIDLSQVPIGFTSKTKIDPILQIKEGEDIYCDFPIVRTGKIMGTVFRDKNRNGIQDKGEDGEENILIYANDAPCYTSFTGGYKFNSVIPGIVRVKIDKKSLPDNFEITTKGCIEINLSPQQEIKNINFGIAEIEPEVEFE